jgi:NADH-quinone oxidoreductase subunit J
MAWLSDIYFFVCAAFAVGGALGVVTSKGAIRGAMGLLLLILSVAGLFLSLRAQFLAAIQLIVYAGAIVVLFLFVIMLLGPSADLPHDKRGRVMRGFGAVVFGFFMLAILIPISRSAHGHGRGIAEPDFGSIDAFGWSLFNNALVPFELSSALLMVAVLGAVAVARGRQGQGARTMPSSQPGLATVLAPGRSPSAGASASHGGT